VTQVNVANLLNRFAAGLNQHSANLAAESRIAQQQGTQVLSAAVLYDQETSVVGLDDRAGYPFKHADLTQRLSSFVAAVDAHPGWWPIAVTPVIHQRMLSKQHGSEIWPLSRKKLTQDRSLALNSERVKISFPICL
jgi:hypothetical protein